MPLSDFQFVDVVGQHRVQPTARVFAFNDELPHVRDVEHSNALSHRLMFLDDAGVLHRHQPTGERHHLCATFHMLVVKRRFLLRGIGHFRTLDFAIGLRNAAANELA